MYSSVNDYSGQNSHVANSESDKTMCLLTDNWRLFLTILGSVVLFIDSWGDYWFISLGLKNNCRYWIAELDRVKRIWYLSPMRAAMVQASLRIRAVSPEPSLLAHTSSESSDRKPDPWPLWMAGHAQLKFVMTECSKTHIRLTRLNWILNLIKPVIIS